MNLYVFSFFALGNGETTINHSCGYGAFGNLDDAKQWSNEKIFNKYPVSSGYTNHSVSCAVVDSDLLNYDIVVNERSNQ